MIQSPASSIGIPKARRGALQVHESLREDILWLRIEPGSALDELALARRFDVSRTPIREALLLLSSEGFVRFLPNRTTIVAPLSLDNAGAYFDTLLLLSRSVARSAAASRQVRPGEIQAHIDRFSTAVSLGDKEAALKARHAFLRQLSAYAGNMFQHRYFDQILDAGVRMLVLHYFGNASGAELRLSATAMASLTEAISDGDEDRSDDCISRMIEADHAIIMRSLQPHVGLDMDIRTLSATRE